MYGARSRKREGRRVSFDFDQPEDYVQTRYNLRGSKSMAYDEDEEPRGRRRQRYAIDQRHRSPSPPPGKRLGHKRAREAFEEDYVVHPLDSFDRYMLAKREGPRGRREHIQPAARREVERVAYGGGRRNEARRTRRPEEDAEATHFYRSDVYSDSEDIDYDKFRQMRRRRGQMDSAARRPRDQFRPSPPRRRRRADEAGEEDENEEEVDSDAFVTYSEGEEEGEASYSDEGEGLMPAPEELDEDQEYITGRRMPIRRRHRPDERDQVPSQRRGGRERMRRYDQAAEEDHDGEEDDLKGLVFTVDQDEGEEEEVEPRRKRRRAREEDEQDDERLEERKRGRKLPPRTVHRHPTYDDMIAEALVKVGKNGKASGVAIFKYIHEHFDMPANDRLVRNHLHQAFERLIDSGKLRHKKASYALPRNLLTEYDARFGDKEEAKDKDEEKQGEKDEEKTNETKSGEKQQESEEKEQKEGGSQNVEQTSAKGEQQPDSGASTERTGEGSADAASPTKKGTRGRKARAQGA